MTKMKLKWRLGKLPEPQEVTLLLDKGLLTKEEAREILFSQETEEDRSKKSLQDEIKFLRELVAKLSTNRSVIVETIREVEKPWKKHDWYQPYYMYSTSMGLNTTGLNYATSSTANTAQMLLSGGNTITGAVAQSPNPIGEDFTNIKTF